MCAIVRIGVVASAVIISVSGCGTSGNQATSSSSDGGSTAGTTASTTDTGGHKWSVGRQLIQDLRWGSESEPENQLLANVRESEATPDQRLVLALNDLGAWYRGQKRYDDAEKTYNRVLDLQKNRLGQHFDVTYTENDLGVVLTDAGKYPEAAEHFKVCLDTGEKMQSDGGFAIVRNDDYAEWQHNYSVLLRKMGKAEESDRMEKAALKMLADRQKAIENSASQLQVDAQDGSTTNNEAQPTESADAKPEDSGSGDRQSTGSPQEENVKENTSSEGKPQDTPSE